MRSPKSSRILAIAPTEFLLITDVTQKLSYEDEQKAFGIIQ